MTQKWWSYDPVADTYDRLLVPHLFVLPAKHLIAALDLSPGQLALDVGTGTGVVALQMIETLGPKGVIGLDPSLEMVWLAKERGLSRLIAGEAPGLPFPEATFDAVLANFVISHFPSHETALSDMVRVLRPGGKLGVTSWGASESEFLRLWRETAEAFVRKDLLAQALRQVVPWEERFSDATHLQEALEEAGLEGTRVQQRQYRVTMSVSDYLAIRETLFTARYMRQMLGEAQWEHFRERLRQVFLSRFHGPVEYTNVVHIAIGRKPHM